MAKKQRTASKKKPGRKKSASKRSHARAGKKWSHEVTTVSTHPPEKLFTRSASEIARGMASKRVSPKGIGSGIKMIQFFINRAGKSLSPTRRRELERAKQILQERQRRAKKRKRKQA